MWYTGVVAKRGCTHENNTAPAVDTVVLTSLSSSNTGLWNMDPKKPPGGFLVSTLATAGAWPDGGSALQSEPRHHER